jgi:hypothetical protein
MKYRLSSLVVLLITICTCRVIAGEISEKSESWDQYVVQEEDTLLKISRKFTDRDTFDAIVKRNAIQNPNRLLIGQVLLIQSLPKDARNDDGYDEAPRDPIIEAVPPSRVPSSPTEEKRQWFPMGGVRYDSVTGFTGDGCLCWAMMHPEQRMCSHDFWIAQIEAGRGGGKLQFGAGLWYFVGGMVKASLLRTWGDPLSGIEPGETYLGAEIDLNFLQLNGALGAYTRVQGNKDGPSSMITWALGVGF